MALAMRCYFEQLNFRCRSLAANRLVREGKIKLLFDDFVPVLPMYLPSYKHTYLPS